MTLMLMTVQLPGTLDFLQISTSTRWFEVWKRRRGRQMGRKEGGQEGEREREREKRERPKRREKQKIRIETQRKRRSREDTLARMSIAVGFA